MYQYLYLGSEEIWLYDFSWQVGMYVLLLFHILQYKQKKLFLSKYAYNIQSFFARKFPDKKFNLFASGSFWAILELIIATEIMKRYIGTINRTFGDIVGTGANYFGTVFFFPFLLLLFYIILRVDPIKQIDFLTPSFALVLVVAKIGCFCAGCCSGIECSWGLYNHNVASGRVEFPVQLVEAGLALLIFFFLLYWRKKAKPGTMFPTYLILYSGTRFFSEFLRNEPEVLWIFKTYHILCIIGVIVGIIELFLVRKFGDRISQFDISCLLAKPFGRVRLFFERKFGDEIRKWKEKKEKKERERKLKREKKIKEKEKRKIVHHHNKSRKKRRKKRH